MKRILVVAGDPSGDVYGAMLIRELRHTDTGISIEAVGGKLIRKALTSKDVFHFDLASLGITGFVEPVRKLPIFFKLLQKLKRLLQQGHFDAVICIDFYGFNKFVLSAAKRAGVSTYYFISPQVWASRPWRIKTIARFVDHMLVIFPFEEALYKRAGVPVTWVGHPLIDLLPTPRLARHGEREIKIGLLPGSRITEVRRHLPVLLKAVTRIRKDFPQVNVTLFAATQLPDSLYKDYIKETPAMTKVRIMRDVNYQERSKQDLVLTSSGTATLENALLGLPMVVLYKLSWPTYFLARALIRVPYIAMANILAGKKLVPELIQHYATPKLVAQAALKFLEDPRRLAATRRELLALRKKLGGPGAIERAARIVIHGTYS